MAITINSVPAPYHSLHEDNYFVFSSTNVLTNNFKFVVDTYVSGNIVSRVKVTPAPTAENSYGIFNPSPVVRNYFTNYFKPNDSGVLQYSSNEIKVNYQIRFGEEVSGVITTNLASGGYSGYNYYSPLFFDGILTLGGGEGDLLLSNQYNNLLISNYTDDWLTERDLNNVELIYGKRLFISYLKNEVSGGMIEVQKINEDGSNSGSSMTGANHVFTGEFNLFNFGEAAINEYLGTTFITGSEYGYKVRLNTANVLYSNWVVIKHVCYERTSPVNVHFLNRLGGWDSFGFNLNNERSRAMERKSFRRNPYQLSGSVMSNNDSFNRFNEGKINFSTQFVDAYKLVSDYVRDVDYEWLAQFVASPIAYLEVQGAYFPITINDTNYRFRKEKAEDLLNLELSIEVGKYGNAQYR